MTPSISIIIPVINEEEHLRRLIPHLHQSGGNRLAEVVVADGGSTDGTVELARQLGARVVETHKGRAHQMNEGVKHTTGALLYFVHADSCPPASFVADIDESLADGYPIGCYRFRFDSKSRVLAVNSYFTRFDRMMCRGGDQTLFVTRELFDQLDGYREQYVIMEDYDFIRRARKKQPFRIIPKDVVVSARKYEENSYLRVNLANLAVFTMYRLGVSPAFMHRTYIRFINHPKE